jgi:hypothetical protein
VAIAKQWEVKLVSMDIVNSPAILNGCMATKKERSQQ